MLLYFIDIDCWPDSIGREGGPERHGGKLWRMRAENWENLARADVDYFRQEELEEIVETACATVAPPNRR